MENRPFGRTGTDVSPIGLGCHGTRDPASNMESVNR